MSIQRQWLDEQLAQVASGRRERVDASLQSIVLGQEEDQARIERGAREALAGAARESARIARLALEEAREAAHHQAIAQRDHLERMEDLEERKLAAAEEARRAEQLARSPCFSSAVQLNRLRQLEALHDEHRALEALNLQAVALAQRLSAALNAVDDATVMAEANAIRVASELRGRALARVKAAALQVEPAQRAVDAAGSPWSPKNWVGPGARAHRAAAQALVHAQEELSRAQAIEQQAIAAHANALTTRCMRMKALAEQTGVESQHAQLAAALDKWVLAAPRSQELVNFWGAGTAAIPLAVDYRVCVALDQARASGAQAVSYPGLGPLPFGDALQVAVERVAELSAAGNPFERGVLAGDRERGWLRAFEYLGVFEPDRDFTEAEVLAIDAALAVKFGLVEEAAATTLAGSGGDFEEPLYDMAVAHVLSSRSASAWRLSQSLRIELPRGADLLQAMRQSGLLGVRRGRLQLLTAAEDRPTA